MRSTPQDFDRTAKAFNLDKIGNHSMESGVGDKGQTRSGDIRFANLLQQDTPFIIATFSYDSRMQ